MRPLEIIIPILLAIYLLWRHPRPLLIRLLPSVAFLLMLIHLAVEGYRWQMIPLYVLTILLAISSWIRMRSSTDWTPIASYLTLIPLAVSMALPHPAACPGHSRSGWTVQGRHQILRTDGSFTQRNSTPAGTKRAGSRSRSGIRPSHPPLMNALGG